jgi:hypothetical protein
MRIMRFIGPCLKAYAYITIGGKVMGAGFGYLGLGYKIGVL